MEVVINPAESGSRLDLALRNAFPEYSRGAIQKAIRQGFCWNDGKRLTDPAAKVNAGQRVALEMPAGANQLTPSEGDLEVLYQDDCLAVCAKPAGLTVHPCPSCSGETLAHRLLARFPQLRDMPGLRPGIVHRLDKDTSGLMLVALTEDCRLRLADAFAARTISKEYLALVNGVTPQAGECGLPIGRHPELKTRMAIVPERAGGRQALTKWRRLWHNERISLLAVRIYSGRTHQIRVHLARQGFPILGDPVYAPANIAKLAPRQMLHAWRLGFNHPVTGKHLDFLLPPPPDFLATALAHSQCLQKIVVTGNQGCGKSSFCQALAALGLPVISADQIVAELYAKKSAATDWIAAYLGSGAIVRGGGVDKAALFRLLQERPEMRREFEQAIHGLVLAEIEQFWQANQGSRFAVAEIPLYFESSYQKMMLPRPFVVGISCPREQRWQRIASNRGWSAEKIETLEHWQWQEERKMAACDQVIANTGTASDLKQAAADFLAWLEARSEEKNTRLMAALNSCFRTASCDGY